MPPPGAVTRGLLTPASTWALVITRLAAKTKPVPSMDRRQDGAVPVILTIEDPATRIAAGTTAGSGGATDGASRVANGPDTAGRSCCCSCRSRLATTRWPSPGTIRSMVCSTRLRWIWRASVGAGA